MYRDNVADLKLDPTEVSEEYIKKSKALLISGTALAQSPSREAVFLALEYARKHEVVVFLILTIVHIHGNRKLKRQSILI